MPLAQPATRASFVTTRRTPNVVKPAHRAPASPCRPTVQKTTVRSAAATAALTSTSAWPTLTECRRVRVGNAQARRRLAFRPAHLEPVALAARPRLARRGSSAATPKRSTAVKCLAQGPALSSRRSAPKNGPRSAVVMGGTTATIALLTRTGFRSDTVASVRTLHRQPREPWARAAVSPALQTARQASSVSSPRLQSAARRTSPASANPARRHAPPTTTRCAVVTETPTRTPAPHRRPASRSRARAPARLHELAAQRPDRKEPRMPPMSSTIVPSSSLSRRDAIMPNAGFCA